MSSLRFFFGTIAAATFCLSSSSLTTAQQTQSMDLHESSVKLPDAPQAQVADLNGAIAPDLSADQQSPASVTQDSSSAQAQGIAQQGSTQAPTKGDREKAEEQLKEQEHQRVAGIMATFNTTRNREALPLSPGQKFRLFFRSSTDPWPFLLAGVVSGIGQANDSYPEWHQGAEGYAKRYGAAYSDAFIGNFFGNAVLPVVLHEDPRYFQKGTGSRMSRLLWAASSTFWCKRDNGKWGPNYANVGGNMIGAAIARAYYPDSERDVASTLGDGITVSVEGIAGAEVIEFWPDIARYLKRRHDEKIARQSAQKSR